MSPRPFQGPVVKESTASGGGSSIERCFGWLWQVVRREEGQRGFVVLSKRWIVERTLAWFGGYRRLSKDYEYLPEVSEAMVQLSAIRIMIRRLA